MWKWNGNGNKWKKKRWTIETKTNDTLKIVVASVPTTMTDFSASLIWTTAFNLWTKMNINSWSKWNGKCWITPLTRRWTDELRAQCLTVTFLNNFDSWTNNTEKYLRKKEPPTIQTSTFFLWLNEKRIDF